MEHKIFYVDFTREGECINLCRGSKDFCFAVYKAMKKVFFLLLPEGFIFKQSNSCFYIYDDESLIFGISLNNSSSYEVY